MRAQIAQRLQEQLDGDKRQPKTIVANPRAKNGKRTHVKGGKPNSSKVSSAKAVVSSQFSNFPNFPNANSNNRNQKPQQRQQQQQLRQPPRQQPPPKKQTLTKIPAQKFIQKDQVPYARFDLPF